MIKRRYRISLLLVLVLAIGGMAFLYYQHRISIPQEADQKTSNYRYPKHPVQIRGFRFDGHHEGRRLISIKADAFTIEKKKLGFFRLGPIKVARFRNAVIDIYGKRKDSVQKVASKSPGQTAKSVQTDVHPMSQGVTFKEVFTEDALPPIPVKRISSILIEPVSINLHDEKSLVTHISAASATISLRKRNILFEGNVRVESGSRRLTTERLVLFPENAVIRTDKGFVLKTPGREFGGEQLTTDIFLKFVESEQTQKSRERM